MWVGGIQQQSNNLYKHHVARYKHKHYAFNTMFLQANSPHNYIYYAIGYNSQIHLVFFYFRFCTAVCTLGIVFFLLPLIHTNWRIFCSIVQLFIGSPQVISLEYTLIPSGYSKSVNGALHVKV